MARLSKPALLNQFEEAVQLGGWSLLYHSKAGQHPARYSILRDNDLYRVRVYIWNISFGGSTSLPNEYRSQVTGVDRFNVQANTRTLILGWWDDVQVFAGWDVR